jgi:NTE family protein
MRPKIALVLGGGGSRGLAHIGVLEVLVREQIPIDYIIGTSMGAIIGGLFAAGYSPQKIADDLDHLRGNNIFNFNFFSARARQSDTEKQLNWRLKGKTFADMKIPLKVMAVDVVHGREVTLEEGDLIPAILASSAVPAVFPPVEIDNMQLADGGVIDSLATHVGYEVGADYIIAVDVYPPLETDDPWIDPLSAIMGFQLPFNLFGNTERAKLPGIAASMWRSFRVMAWHLHEERLKAAPPDVLLRPMVGGYGSLDFTDVDGPIQVGRLEAENHLPMIKSLLELPDQLEAGND